MRTILSRINFVIRVNCFQTIRHNLKYYIYIDEKRYILHILFLYLFNTYSFPLISLLIPFNTILSYDYFISNIIKLYMK